MGVVGIYWGPPPNHIGASRQELKTIPARVATEDYSTNYPSGSTVGKSRLLGKGSGSTGDGGEESTGKGGCRSGPLHGLIAD